VFGKPWLICLAVAAVLLGYEGCRAETLWSAQRPADAPGASRISAEITSQALSAREERIYREICAGNVPDHLRALQPVHVSALVAGTTHTATYFVTADYLALGSSRDFLRIPMSPVLAQRLADALHASLPTRKMVNDIWAQASTKLEPLPIPPSPAMGTVPVFCDHQRMIEEQCASTSASLTGLVAGIKKDVVLTARLLAKPTQVAIYGWQRSDGSAIQPLSTVHANTYADYSHGIRLVAETMTLDGQSTSVKAVLADPALSALLSDEGPLNNVRYPTVLPPPTPAPAKR
jgi:hypothetical protein